MPVVTCFPTEVEWNILVADHVLDLLQEECAQISFLLSSDLQKRDDAYLSSHGDCE